MKQLLTVVVVSGLTFAACSGDPTSSDEYQELEQQLAAAEQRIEELAAERDPDAEPLAAIPDEPVIVAGTSTCEVLEDEGTGADGTPTDVWVCDLSMSDPRVSGTQRDDGWRLIDAGSSGFAWELQESIITNDEGTWRGSVQGADTGGACGEAHYVGEGAYDGLEFHHYFCDNFGEGDDDETTLFKGWISADG